MAEGGVLLLQNPRSSFAFFKAGFNHLQEEEAELQADKSQV